MDKVQSILLDLLIDIDRICAEHNLTYFLGKDTALHAVRWGGFPDNCHTASVFMPRDDYDRFEHIVGDSPLPNRAVESLLTNPSFPYICMRYVDTQSTYLSLCSALREEKPGIGVFISKLQPYNNRSKRKLSLIRAFGSLRYSHAFGEEPKRNVRRLNKKRVELLEKRGAHAIERIYKAKLIRTNGNYDKVYVQRHFSSNLYFDKHIFDSSKRVSFEGALLSVPTMHHEYLSIMHGRRWGSREFSYGLPNTNLFIDADTPFDVYLPLVKENTEIINKVVEARYTRSRSLRQRREARKPLDMQQRYYTRAVDRVRMEDQYLSQKERILDLYRAGDFESVAILLLDYQTICEKYARWSMGFAFDKDLHDVMCNILAWERILATRKRLLKLRSESFSYLEELGLSSPSQNPEEVYFYRGKELGFERCDKPESYVPVATQEQIDRITMMLRAKAENIIDKSNTEQSDFRIVRDNDAHDNQEVE